MENTVKEEFDRIKYNIFYMDWNVISYLRNPDDIKNDELRKRTLCLSNILFGILNKNYFVIPYSNAHLLDIFNGSKEYEKPSLEFIDKISSNWQISEEFSNKEILRIDKIQNIFDNYNSYHESLTETNKYTICLSQLLEPLFDFVKQYIEYTTDLNETTQKHKEEIADLLTCLFPMNDEELKIKLLKKNKNYKFNLKDLEGKKIKFPNYESAKAKCPHKNIKEIVDFCIKMSDLPFDSLEDIKIKLNFNNYTPALSQFHNKISNLYFLAEFINVSTEKLDSKTAFQGIVNDQFHINYGLRCNIFITEDDALYKKGKFIKDWIQSNTHIFKIDDFNRHLLCLITKQALQNSSEVSINRDEFIYTFKDNEDQVIKEYTISLDEINNC